MKRHRKNYSSYVSASGLGRRSQIRNTVETVTSHQIDMARIQNTTTLATVPGAQQQPDAMIKVFAIPELLTCIILSLPQEDILLAAKVSTAWRNLITDSTTIHQYIKEADLWDAPADDQPYSHFANYFEHVQFSWGTILIRRLSDVEVIAVLSPPEAQSSWFTIVNGRDKVVTLSVNVHKQGPTPFQLPQRFSYKVEFRDDAAERFHSEHVVRFEWAKPRIVEYLERFHKDDPRSAEGKSGMFRPVLRSRGTLGKIRRLLR